MNETAREIHFYESQSLVPEYVKFLVSGYVETLRAIDYYMRGLGGDSFAIHTLQMGALDIAWHAVYGESDADGYRFKKEVAIFIHDKGGAFEISTWGVRGCERTDKALRPAHSIFRMYAAGAFETKRHMQTL